MGWVPPSIKQWETISRHWVRNIHTNDTRLNKRIFNWARQKANSSCKNCFFTVKNKFDSLQLFTYFDINNSVNRNKFIDIIHEKLMSVYIAEWESNVNQITGVRGIGRNKLRTYRLFKTEFKTEQYCKFMLPMNHRSAFAKFRCGVAPLKLETGRYEGISETDRLCPFCRDSIEDECHVLFKCTTYQDIREELTLKALSIDANFNTFDDCDKMKFIFSNEDMIRICAKTCFKLLKTRTNILYK